MGNGGGGSGRGNAVIGLLTAGLGLFFVLISLGIIPASRSQAPAPLWIGGLAGLAFLLAGVAVATARPGAAPGSVMTNPVLGGAIFALMVVIANWVAFGPGERRVSGDLALPFIAVGGRMGEWTGRAAFGIGAVIMDLLVVWLVVRGVRRLVRQRRERAGQPAP